MAKVLAAGRLGVGKMCQMKPTVVSSALQKHTASVIFLHGSGDSGDNFLSFMNNAFTNEFSFPHIQVVYPTAPCRPYTPMHGVPTNVWFDRPDISPQSPENVTDINEMCDYLDGLVAQMWNKDRISPDRIIVGGFSMGGALALHFGYRYCTDLAGVFALSSFLQEKSSVYEAIKDGDSELPPLYQTHGVNDNLVLAQWGGATHKRLRQLGVSGQYQVFKDTGHELTESMVEGLRHWILTKLPVDDDIS